MRDAMQYNFNQYAGKSSLNEIERLKKYCECFNPKTTEQQTIDKAKTSWIYLYGSNGTQKTTCSLIVGKTLVSFGYDCRYTLMKTLIDNLWNSQRDETSKQKVDEWLNCDVLIIDEAFSKDKLHLWQSGNQIGYIDEFLRERINLGKGCIFVSNTRPEDVEKQGFSHSIQDLLLRELKKQNGLMEFKDNYFDSISESEMPETLF